mgnify:CR=1 FL=1
MNRIKLYKSEITRKVIYSLILIVLSSIATAHQYEGTYLPIKSYINTSFNNYNNVFDIYLEKCSTYNRTPYFNICVAPYYKELLKTNSSYEVLKLAESHVWGYKNVTSDCHFIAHEIGSEVYHKNNESILDSIRECSDIWLCGGGCHHQIFIEYMDNKSVEEIVEARDLICSKEDSSLPTDFQYTCYHSFGHSMALYFDFELENAKSFCSSLEDEYAYECLDGIYHQNYFRYLDMEFDGILNNPSLLCKKKLSGVELKACYERAGKFALTYYGYYDKKSFIDGSKLCLKFSFKEKMRCFNGLLVFPENCDKSKYSCNFLIYKTKFLNWFYDSFLLFNLLFI